MKMSFIYLTIILITLSCQTQPDIESPDDQTQPDIELPDDQTQPDIKSLDCGGGRHDESAGLCWQHPKTSEYYWYQEAIDYCDNLDLGGHDNWRLPSLENFTKLLGGCDSDVLYGESGFCNSCEKSLKCNALFGSSNGYHGSSSTYEDGFSWYVNLYNGQVNWGGLGHGTYVRCVRHEVKKKI